MFLRFLILLLPFSAILVDTASYPWSRRASSPPSSPPSPQLPSSRLLLVSFDGFRHDYLDKTDTPNFDRLVKSGVRAKWVRDAFISKTFPNHFTIVTGLYEESHGIVSNSFYDPSLNETFQMSSNESKWWSIGAEPIWVTNQLQKPHAQSGVFFWPGSESVIKNVTPTYFKKYNKNITMPDRIDAVVSWFHENPSLNLGLLYYHEPDRTAHKFGPDSPQVEEQIRECDKFVGYLLDRLDEKGILSSLNIIVTADHGFAQLKDASSSVVLERVLGPKGLEFEAFGSSPALGVWPKQKNNFTAVKLIYDALRNHPANMSVYLKNDIPPRYHYSASSRIAPILVLADLGYGVVADNTTYELWYKKRRGEHGYDNEVMDMHPFFVATGPAFKSGGILSKPFDNVDIYPLMCLILGLEPAPNNGSLRNICALSSLPACREYDSFQNFGIWALTIVGLGLCATVAAIYIVVAVRRQRQRRRGVMSDTPLEKLGVGVESAAMDVRWDEDGSDADGGADYRVESVFAGDNSRVSKWRSWSRNWKRKWMQLRHTRGKVDVNDEGESLLMATTQPPPHEAMNNVEDPLDQLPKHLVDALRR